MQAESAQNVNLQQQPSGSTIDSGKEVSLDNSYNNVGNPNSTTLHGHIMVHLNLVGSVTFVRGIQTAGQLGKAFPINTMNAFFWKYASSKQPNVAVCNKKEFKTLSPQENIFHQIWHWCQQMDKKKRAKRLLKTSPKLCTFGPEKNGWLSKFWGFCKF